MFRTDDGYTREIGKIRRTQLGFEDHGIMTAMLDIDYGDSSQSIGGYSLDSSCGPAMALFVEGILRATGVDFWEKVVGRTVFVLSVDRRAVGIEPLPTEKGTQFLFASIIPGGKS